MSGLAAEHTRGVDWPTGQKLESLERERLRALRDCDLTVVERLHADDYELIAPGGRALSFRDYVGLITSGDFTYETFEPASPVRVRVFDSVALLRYQARIVVIDATGATDSGLFWHTDIWELHGDRWQAVWSQATRIRQSDAEMETQAPLTPPASLRAAPRSGRPHLGSTGLCDGAGGRRVTEGASRIEGPLAH